MNGFSSWAGDNKLKALVFIVLALAAAALAAYTYYTIKQSRYTFTGPNTVSVMGKGEIFARPDIATFSFSVMAEAQDAAAAQSQSAEKINAIMAHLREQGIEERDITTLWYNLSPRYEYIQAPCTQFSCPPGRQNMVGFTANQSIEVKVRDTEKASELIAGIGELGATDVSGISFTVDDVEALQRDAREAAIADAKANAERLAEDLDVRLVRLINFWEDTSPYYGYGKGGDMMESSAYDMAAVAPELPMGESTVTSNITLVYEIR